MSEKPEIQISFTKEQLEDFLDVVCLGEWMINATRIERIKKYDDLAQRVFKAAKDAGIEGVEYDEEDKTYWLTREFEDSILQEFKDEYDNETFWDDLPDRLAERDLEKKFGRKAVEAMDNETRFKERMRLCQKYENEFEKNGIERVEVRGLEG